MLSKLTLRRAAAAAVAVLLAALFGWLIVGVKIDGDADHSNGARARAEMKILAAALEEFRKAHGRYPDKIDEVESLRTDRRGPLSSHQKDPWGTPYVYRTDQKGFALYSAGRNRRDDSQTDDDIVAASK